MEDNTDPVFGTHKIRDATDIFAYDHDTSNINLLTATTETTTTATTTPPDFETRLRAMAYELHDFHAWAFDEITTLLSQMYTCFERNDNTTACVCVDNTIKYIEGFDVTDTLEEYQYQYQYQDVTTPSPPSTPTPPHHHTVLMIEPTFVDATTSSTSSYTMMIDEDEGWSYESGFSDTDEDEDDEDFYN